MQQISIVYAVAFKFIKEKRLRIFTAHTHTVCSISVKIFGICVFFFSFFSQLIITDHLKGCEYSKLSTTHLPLHYSLIIFPFDKDPQNVSAAFKFPKHEFRKTWEKNSPKMFLMKSIINSNKKESRSIFTG